MEKNRGLTTGPVIGKDEDVSPRRVDPPPGMPARAQAVVATLSSAARLNTLRFLKEHPGATANEIADGTELPLRTVHVVLKELKDRGYVTATEREHDAGRGRPAAGLYVTRDRLVEDILSLVTFLT